MKALVLILTAVLAGLRTMSAATCGHDYVEAADTVTLGEVNVVSVKQQRQLFDSPTASTQLSQEELDRLSVVSIKGITDIVPNFYVPDYGSRMTSSIYVRGIGSRIDQPSVGLIVDNVPYLNKDAYDFDLCDMTSVEMLRGPQSTLFGRNTMAGLINVRTLSPMRWQGWKLMGEFTTGVAGKAGIGWYHKLGEVTGISANILFSGARGNFRNEYTGRRLDHERYAGARIKYEWNITPDLSLRNSLQTGCLSQGGYPYASLETGCIAYNDTCFYRRFTLTDGLTLSRRFNGSLLTSVSSVQYINDNMTLDQDFLPEDFFTLTQKKQEIGFTEDIVWRSFRDADEIRVVYNWLVGIFGFYRHLDMQAPVTFKDKGISDLIEYHSNNATPDYPIVWDSRSFALNSDFSLPSGGVALYHESKLDVGRWHLTAGLRFDFESSSMAYRNYCSTGYTIFHLQESASVAQFYAHAPVRIDVAGNITRSYLNIIPRLAAVFDLSGGLGNVYANISRGFKAGGYNTQMFSDVLQQRLMNMMGIGMSYDIDEVVGYKPEKSWNYELGCHISAFDGKLNGELSLFYIDCRDQQLTMFPDGTTTGRIMTNAGRTRSYGGELSLSWRPVDSFLLNGSFGTTQARFIRFFDGINDYRGKRLPYVPSNTMFLQGLYTIETAGCKLESVTFDINVRGNGNIYWNESNTRKQPFYVIAGCSVIFSFGNLSFQLWGKNMTSTRYDTFYFMSMGNEFLQRGRPVEGGLTVRFDI